MGKNVIVKKVMFVCLGNICRSPLAHAAFQKLVDDRGLSDHYIISSSGTGDYHVGERSDRRMRKTGESHGLVMDHLGQHFHENDLDRYDIILPMDENNYHDILRLRPHDGLNHVQLFRDYDPQGRGDVPDPYYGGGEGFELVYEMVSRTCEHLLAALEAGACNASPENLS